MIRAVSYDASRIDNAAIMFEAHGTGTMLGDPIEVGSIMSALSNGLTRMPVEVQSTSLKANIGHLEAAAAGGGMSILYMMCS